MRQRNRSEERLRIKIILTGFIDDPQHIVFLGGSIAAKIVPKMKDPVFLESFLDKGRMETILKDMPVKIVANDDSGLIGAARYTLVQKAFRTSGRAGE